jgi:hypothetical protein
MKNAPLAPLLGLMVIGFAGCAAGAGSSQNGGTGGLPLPGGSGGGGGGAPDDGSNRPSDASTADGSGGMSGSADSAETSSDAMVSADLNDAASKVADGPFTCTELIGLFSSGEWWDAGFFGALGELKVRWQGRFSHYGYTYEYAKADSYAWSPTNVGGVNNVRLTAPCAQNAAAPDRIVYQAWSWELTTEKAWIESLEAALVTIQTKRPSVRRIDLMTIIRCPMNGWCHGDKPPLGPNTDHDATKQDCHVPDYVDSAFAKVAANHPALVSVAPRFEAVKCAAQIDGIHLHEQNGPAAAPIAAYYKAMP